MSENNLIQDNFMETEEFDDMARPQFVITKTFLGKLNMECPGTPDLMLTSTDKTIAVDTKINVLSAKINDDSFYMVEMNVGTAAATDIGLKAHELSFIYVAFVKINDIDMDEDSIHLILNSIVPQLLFNNINAIIFNVTNATGYPLLLDKKIYEDSIIDNGTKDLLDDDLSENIKDEAVRVNYQSIIKNLMKNEDVAQFFSTYNKYLGKIVTDDYENLPAYFYYLRFFIPIEYSHPDFKECDDSVWPMLFQLLFSNPDVTCRVIDIEDCLPEIEFTYDYFNETYISYLTLCDLKDLLDSLLSDMFAKTSVEMLDFNNIDFPYSLQFHNDRLIHRKEFFKMYGYDKVELIPAKQLDLLEKMYSRIKNCDIQTVLYRY